MSLDDFTLQQRDAIELTDRALLVSAGAGAGKTTVLVQRVIRSILAGVDVDRLLVVTFTDAAAEEMRERVGRALAAARARSPHDRRLAREEALLPQAEISTLHAFCLRTIRRYFHRLQMDPLVRVMAQGEAALLQQEVLDQVLESRYRHMDAGLVHLVERYGGGSDAAIRDAVVRLHRLAFSGRDPDAWLHAQLARLRVAAGAPLDATPWVQGARSRLRRGLTQAATALARARDLVAGGACDVIEADYARVTDLAERLDLLAWDRICAAGRAVDTWETLRLEREMDPQAKLRVQRLRERAKREVRALRPILRPGEEHLAELEALAPAVEALVNLVRDFDQALGRVKTERRILDFMDMERAMLELVAVRSPSGQLTPSPVARALAARFEAVLVDEYQDINEVQDAIVHLLARGGPSHPTGLFLVGDVKQSIYRFRQAEPGLFLARRAALSPVRRADGSLGPQPSGRIELNANFRSRPAVIAAINHLFQRILTPGVAGMEYGEADRLHPGVAYPPAPSGLVAGDVPAELHLVERASAGDGPDTDPGEDPDGAEVVDLTALEREAAVVAGRIQTLVCPGANNAVGVFDPITAAYRPICYRDVVVLLRSVRSKAAAFVEALARAGIPVSARLRTGFFERVEVEVVMALLALLDNPHQDIPLASVLRFPLWGFSAAELARIRLAGPDGDFYDALRRVARSEPPGPDDPARVTFRPRVHAFLSALDRWRTLARRGPLSELIAQLYDDTGLMAYVGGMPGGRQRRANLLALVERARQFDTFSRQGLARFLQFVARVRETGEDMGDASADGEGQDVVRVMTVHHSKGLEFPVVILADLGARFRPPSGDFILDRELGVGAVCVDPELRVKYPSIAYHAVAERNWIMGLAEEMRVLYVALTRSRERLILVGSVRDLADACEGWQRWTGTGPLPDGLLGAAHCALDWIGPALAGMELSGPGFGRWEGGNRESTGTQGTPWRVHLWPADSVAAAAAGGGAPAPPPVPTDPEPTVGAVLERLAWTYPWQPLVSRFAKRAVTELKGPVDPERARTPTPADLRAWTPRAPRFAAGRSRAGRAALTGAARGRAVHALLERLDLTRTLDEAGVRQQLREMVAARRLARDEAAALEDVGPVVRFLASPLGARLRRDPTRVLREWTFTLLMDARRVYPDLPPAAAAGEHVVVQGSVDCLVEEENGFLLLDFKTDAASAGSLDPLVERYRTQLSVYREAVQAVMMRPVPEAYLYFLAAGIAVAV